jgi:hypothetical protein
LATPKRWGMFVIKRAMIGSIAPITLS